MNQWIQRAAIANATRPPVCLLNVEMTFEIVSREALAVRYASHTSTISKTAIAIVDATRASSFLLWSQEGLFAGLAT